MPQGKSIPPHTLAIGAPVKILKPLTSEQRADIADSADHYIQAGTQYRLRVQGSVAP